MRFRGFPVLMSLAVLTSCGPGDEESPPQPGDDDDVVADDDDSSQSDDDDDSSQGDDDDSAPQNDGCTLDFDPERWIETTDVALELDLQDRLRRNRGLAAEDFDLDGDVDLYLGNPGDPPTFFVNQGDGSFLQHPSPPQTPIDSAQSTADYDNDGDPDLYISCGGFSGFCVNALFRNDGVDGDGWPAFTDVSESSGIAGDSTANFGGSWADYDRDGDVDLFVPSKILVPGQAVTTRDYLYRNEGDGSFTEVGVEAGIAAEGHTHQAAWLDYDEDGWPDLYVPSYIGENRLFHNEGDGSFELVTPPALQEPERAFAAVAADFNNDGHMDILVAARSDLVRPEDGGGDKELIPQLHGLFLGDGAGGWEDLSLGTGLNDEGDPSTYVRAMGFQVGDWDLDGWLEVVFGNGGPGAGEFNTMGTLAPGPEGGLRWWDRTATIDYAPAEDGLEPPYNPYPYRSHGMAFADLDSDGDVDLFVANGGPMPDGDLVREPNRLFRNDTAQPNQVRVELEGSESPRDGTGAVVRLANGPPEDSSWQVVRQAFPASGFNSAQPRILRIGSGQCPGPYHVTVRWPSGAVQEIEGVEAGTHLQVLEQDSAR